MLRRSSARWLGFLSSGEKDHGEPGDGGGGDGAARPGLAAHGDPGAAADAGEADDEGEDLPEQVFDEHEAVDANCLFLK